MTIRYSAYILILSACLSACVTPPSQEQLSREEWLQIKNRQYDNVTPEIIFKKTEQLFTLADENDVKFTYNNEKMTAIRWTAPFPTHIWYHWDIGTKQVGSAVNVSVNISTTASGLGVSGGMEPHDSSSAIDLFFSRLEYLLGRSGTWHSCDGYMSANPYYTTLDALCMLAEDGLPPSEQK